MPNLLQADGVSKHFGGVAALRNAHFALQRGEVHALIGENGAGKSTLIKIVTGLYKPDSGRLLLDGRSVEFASPRDALLSAIGAVHQRREVDVEPAKRTCFVIMPFGQDRLKHREMT